MRKFEEKEQWKHLFLTDTLTTLIIIDVLFLLTMEVTFAFNAELKYYATPYNDLGLVDLWFAGTQSK